MSEWWNSQNVGIRRLNLEAVNSGTLEIRYPGISERSRGGGCFRKMMVTGPPRLDFRNSGFPNFGIPEFGNFGIREFRIRNSRILQLRTSRHVARGCELPKMVPPPRPHRLGLWDSGILLFWDFGILEFWDSVILEVWDHGVLEFLNSRIREFWDPWIPDLPTSRAMCCQKMIPPPTAPIIILEFCDSEILECWGPGILDFWDSRHVARGA